MNEQDKLIIEELTAAREKLAAVERPRGEWRAAMRSAFTEDVDAELDPDPEGTPVVPVAEWKDDLGAVPPPTQSFRARMRTTFAAATPAMSESADSAESSVAQSPPLHEEVRASRERGTQNPAPVLRGPWSRRVAGVCALAAAVALVVMTQWSSDATSETPPAPAAGWALVSASSADAIEITPLGAAPADDALMAKLAGAEVVDVGESDLTLSSAAGIDVALRGGGRLEGRPFAGSELRGEDDGIFLLANGNLLVRSTAEASAPIHISTHFGEVVASGALSISSEDVGLLLAVVEGSATFTPVARSGANASEGGDKAAPKAYEVPAEHVLVIPYPDSDPVVAGFDNEMCTRTDSLRIFIADLVAFSQTGRLP